MPDPFVPPRPRQLRPWQTLAKIIGAGDGDLLSFLPDRVYDMTIGSLGFSRRGIVIVNAPDLLREVLHDRDGRFPKSDLMVGALKPLVGPSVFVAEGREWQCQRRMIEPAFSAMRVDLAFEAMQAAVEDCEAWMAMNAGATVSLDFLMSELTADAMCRTVFSRPLGRGSARAVFDAFRRFQDRVAQVEIRRLIWDRAWTPPAQSTDFLNACTQIRSLIDAMIEEHAGTKGDLAESVISAVDPQTGRRFSREEVVDQLSVFFLAGHETTASALIWTFWMLASRPDLRAAVRAEIEVVAGSGDLDLAAVRQLSMTRAVFRETLRLYPPITFFPRVALDETRLGGIALKRGTLLLISPWVVHRHRDLWRCPDQFDAGRFAQGREKEIRPGSYMPFGQGPRVCPGAAFATIEATLILARLIRRFDFELVAHEGPAPVARVTTKPDREVMVRLIERPRASRH